GPGASRGPGGPPSGLLLLEKLSGWELRAVLRALLIFACAAALPAQEADSGFELRTTLSGTAHYANQLEAPPRSGAPLAAGCRAMLYPTWKVSRNWAISGAIQIHSRPYFQEELSTLGYGVKTDVLQAHLSYSRF